MYEAGKILEKYLLPKATRWLLMMLLENRHGFHLSSFIATFTRSSPLWSLDTNVPIGKEEKAEKYKTRFLIIL